MAEEPRAISDYAVFEPAGRHASDADTVGLSRLDEGSGNVVIDGRLTAG